MEGDLLKEVAKMGDEDYMAFVVKTFNARGPLTQKTLQRRLGLQGKKNCKKAGDGWKGMLVEGDPTEYPSKPKPTSSKEASCAAFKVTQSSNWCISLYTELLITCRLFFSGSVCSSQ